MDPEKPGKNTFSGVIVACYDVLTHQRVYVLHVMVIVARRYGCLTGVSSYFQLFEPYKTVADGGNAILHQRDGGTKWSAMIRCFPFLEETSERDEI